MTSRTAAMVALVSLLIACSLAQAGILIEIQQFQAETRHAANAVRPATRPSLTAAIEQALSETAAKENCVLAISHLAELKQPFSTSIQLGKREIKIAGEAKVRAAGIYALKLGFKDQDALSVAGNADAVSVQEITTNVDVHAGQWIKVGGAHDRQLMVRITEQSAPSTQPAANR